MSDRETIVAFLAARGTPFTAPPRPEAPRNVLLIGRGGGTFNHVLGTDGRALQGPQ